MNQLALGIQRRDEGMALASGKADRVEPGWNEKALEYMKLFLGSWPLDEFTGEEAQMWMLNHGLTRPASNNAWGMVLRNAAKRGLIAKTEKATQSQKPEAHARLIPVWRKA